jgi:hypothetical protein
MKRIDIIGKEIEILKARLILFMAISGGSWVYIYKLDIVIIKIVLIVVFFISSYGVFSNTIKLSDLYELLKGFRDA